MSFLVFSKLHQVPPANSVNYLKTIETNINEIAKILDFLPIQSASSTIESVAKVIQGVDQSPTNFTNNTDAENFLQRTEDLFQKVLLQVVADDFASTSKLSQISID